MSLSLLLLMKLLLLLLLHLRGHLILPCLELPELVQEIDDLLRCLGCVTLGEQGLVPSVDLACGLDERIPETSVSKTTLRPP